ncbi:hypothetical protein AMAG_00738 [Allomyces macrogynus ATCC 38327]|uniref:GATA-type domain-containing protein n=1 Tax=Allomyces macrogynus (strain ATCC 38327) TaxID=578462 RepID=A0A0L0RXC6_ALLM3|nr:hypothetical protein AMAG_00738 [Allomyces macrogynus ATCC 38327]|eukprot:KNE54784.1 hypothetical protein AMAG_00738 [Allomyces macrogynus ATCC 38327]
MATAPYTHAHEPAAPAPYRTDRQYGARALAPAAAQPPADLYQYQHHRPPPPPSLDGVEQQHQPPQQQPQQAPSSGGLRSPATQPWGARGDGGPASDAHAHMHPSIALTVADVPVSHGDAAGRGPGLCPPNAPTTTPRTNDADTGYSMPPAPPTHTSPAPSRASRTARLTAMAAPAASAGPLARAPSVSGRGPLQPPPPTHQQEQQPSLPPLAHAVPPPPHLPPPQVPLGPPVYPPGYYGPDPYGPPPPPGPPGVPSPGYQAGYPRHDASFTVPAPPPDHFADVLFDLHHLVRVVCLLRDRVHGPPPPPGSPATAAYGRTRYTDARSVRAHLDEAHATASRLFMRVDDWYEHMLAPWIPPPPPPHGMARVVGGHPGYAPGYAMPPPPLSQQQQHMPLTADQAGYPPGPPPLPPSVPPQFDRGGSMYPAPPPDVDEDALQPPPPPRFLGGPPPPSAAGYRPPTADPTSQGYSDPRAPSLGSPEDFPVRDRDWPRFDAPPYHGHQAQGDFKSPTPLSASMPVPPPASTRPWPDAHNGGRGHAFGGSGVQFAAHHVLAPQKPPPLDLSDRIPPIQSPPGARYASVTGTGAEASVAAAAANPSRVTAQGGGAVGGQAMDDMGGEDDDEGDDNDDGDEEDDDEDEAHTRRKRARKIGHPAVGHCLSCKTTEAPEWRRGPMGRGTLCNACGLHWAKLRRKLGDNAPMRGPPPGACGASASAAAATTTTPSSSSLSRVPTSTDSSSPAPTPAVGTVAAPTDAPPRAARGTRGGRRALSTTRRAAAARERQAPAQEDE